MDYRRPFFLRSGAMRHFREDCNDTLVFTSKSVKVMHITG